MERLTRRAKDGSGNTYLEGNADVCWAGVPAEKRNFCVGCPDLKNRDRAKCGPCLLIDRLAAYEDTGLGPEEVAAALRRTAEHDKAMDEGLWVGLPCKVGDTVWTNFAMTGWYFRDKDKPYSAKVVFVGLNGSEEMGGGLVNIVYGKHDYMTQFSFSDIGKTVFLTRTEAEAALSERGGEE